MMKKIFPSKIHESVTQWIKIAEKLHEIQPLKQAQKKIKLMKKTRAYAWRKWNWKLWMWEKIYKPYPPRDPFYSRD